MSEVAAALTKEEWEIAEEFGAFKSYDGRAISATDASDHYEFHRAAALCLHNQPFGFTREMVEAGRFIDGHEGVTDGEGRVYLCTWIPERLYAALREMTDNVEALLPPEDVSDG